MLIPIVIIVVLIVTIPAGLYLYSLGANIAFGHWDVVKARGGFLGWRLVAGCIGSMMASGFIIITYGACLLPWPRPDKASLPVLMVHGLYHNRSAWIVFRRRLERAGFRNNYAYGYNSITRKYPQLVEEASARLDDILEQNPGKQAVLVGHSLGGLVVRGIMGQERFKGRVRCTVTLGTPHGGSLLGRIGIGSLARSLRYMGPLVKDVQAMDCQADVHKLSLYAPIDNMVMPVEALRTEGPGWQEQECSVTISHVALIYSREVARKAISFLKEQVEEK